MDHPFEVLGVRAGATEREVRAAFRRLVLDTHPDRHRGDRGANDRLQRIVEAYEHAIAILRGGPIPPRRAYRHAHRPSRSRRPPPAAPPSRYVCDRCGDTFEIRGDCFRCDRALRDSVTSSPPRPSSAATDDDPRVEQLIARLSLRMPAASWMDARWAPWLAAAAFVLYGAAVTSIGLRGMGTMLIAFGLFLAAGQITQGTGTRPVTI